LTDRILLSPPDVGTLEREYLLRALDGGWIAPCGPDIDAFESEVADAVGWPGAVALASGTSALHLALLSIGVAPGDEVLVSTFTFVATANAIRYCGAEPVFIDSGEESWNMSPRLLADELTAAERRGRLPKAVIVVDLYGECAAYDELLPQCRELGVRVIEDAAEAIGSSYKGRPAGTLADLGVYSFNGNKIITTSGGGMVVAPDEGIARHIRYLAAQAREPVSHYEHTMIGFNYRLSNLLAALGRAQFRRLSEMSMRRRRVNALYRSSLAGHDGLTFMPIRAEGEWNGWLTCLLFPDRGTRDRVHAALASKEIESRPLWKPMHLQPVYSSARARAEGSSQVLFERGLCVPSGSALSEEQVGRVVETIVESI
jgi:dTDP-4-amino-4,6-dideoxygalactose transaminase